MLRPMIQFSSDKGIDLLGRSITDRTLIRTSWILPLVSVLLATVIHYMSGNYRDIPFFISETDHPGIEDQVFSIGLFCSAMIQLLVSIRLYVLFKPIASPKLHHIALVCGIATSTHLSVLAFVTMDQNIEVHVYTAFICIPWWLCVGLCHPFLTSKVQFKRKDCSNLFTSRCTCIPTRNDIHNSRWYSIRRTGTWR